MVLSEFYGFVKYTLICVNLIFFAIGLTTVVLSVWMLTDPSFVVSMAQKQEHFHAGLYILLIAGLVMLMVVLLGCCGAFKESSCGLVCFFGSLLVVVVVQIAVGVWLYANSDRLRDELSLSVINTVKKEYGGENAASHTHSMDTFHVHFKCCGGTSPFDWAGSKYSNKTDTSDQLGIGVSDHTSVFRVPDSCCKDINSTACIKDRQMIITGNIGAGIYPEGCIDKLMVTLNSLSTCLFGFAIAILILELIGLIFSLVLYCGIGSADRYKA